MIDSEIIRSLAPESIEYDHGDDFSEEEIELPEDEAEEEYILTDPDEVDPFAEDAQPTEYHQETPSASWQEVKAQLNYWGEIFSKDIRRRSEATMEIFRLFEQVTFAYKTLLEGEPDAGAKKRYAGAVYELRSRFFGEQDAPIRFLKKVYPEELFYCALYHTLGIAIDKDATEDAEQGEETFAEEEQLFNGSSAYNAAKGATYVTYFVSTLRIFCLRRARKLCRDHAREAHIFAQNTLETQLQQTSSDTESEVIRAEELRLQTATLLRFAELVITAKFYRKKLVIQQSVRKAWQEKTHNKRVAKSVQPHQLELYYSFILVNLSRSIKKPVSQKADAVLMGAASEDFLRFTTTILEFTFPDLMNAELSETVIASGFYYCKQGELLLQQQAVALYYGTEKAEITRIFNNAKIYLSGTLPSLSED